MVRQFSLVGLFDATTDRGTKMPVFFEQPQGGILHQLLGVRATMVGDLRKLRFLLGREVYFHGSESSITKDGAADCPSRPFSNRAAPGFRRDCLAQSLHLTFEIGQTFLDFIDLLALGIGQLAMFENSAR